MLSDEFELASEVSQRCPLTRKQVADDLSVGMSTLQVVNMTA